MTAGQTIDDHSNRTQKFATSYSKYEYYRFLFNCFSFKRITGFFSIVLFKICLG